MRKKILAAFLAATMGCGILTGCGSSSEEAVLGTNSSASADEEEADFDEITTIEYYCINFYGSDSAAVEEAVNAISEEEIGVHVNFHMMDMDAYLNQIGTSIAAGEQIDLMTFTPASPITYTGMLSQNQLMDITDLLEEYGQDILDVMGDYLDGTSSAGSVYAVGTKSGFATQAYVIMRKDILDELGLTEQAQNISSWTEYEEILDAVYQANQDGTLSGDLTTNACVSNCDSSGAVIPNGWFLAGSDDWSDAYGIDKLGDSYGIVATDQDTNTVYPIYESEDYYAQLERVRTWYQNGWLYKDAAITDEDGDTLMSNGVTFSFIITGQVGVEETRKSNTGYEVVAAKIVEIPMDSSVTQTWGNAIPVTAKEPEAAMKFLNLLYSNSEVENLLVWGIEGTDYTVNEEGEAVKTEDYTYASNMFLYGDGTLSYPGEGQGGDYMEKLAQADEDAEISAYMGFAADTADISNELTACKNVIDQYLPSLLSGTSNDLEADYAAFCSAMEDAGVQLIIDSYQAQLDEWLSE